MSQSLEKNLEWLVAVLLGLGILPSFTALSIQISELSPHLAGYLGPINFLKLGTPFLLLFLVLRRAVLPCRTIGVLLVGLGVLFVATFFSGLRCHFPSSLLRETASITLGLIAASAFLVLGSRPRVLTLLFWCAVIGGSALLDKISSSTMDWFFLNISDPNTLGSDFAELGQRALTGVFGRQSMAKILAWTPFIVLAFFSADFEKVKNSTRRWLLGFAIVFTGLILATSQRGPFLGAMVGWCVFAVHQYFKMGNRKRALTGMGVIAASLIVTALAVPSSILVPRIHSMTGTAVEEHFTQVANDNRDFRLRMWNLSFDVIEHYPWGDSCIPMERFEAARLHPFHAHNLFLQQFRERGWLWGLVHMVLWLLALVGAWRSRDPRSSFLVGGIATVLVLGMVDHPWFVLNQAMMLGVLLIAGLQRYLDRDVTLEVARE